MMPPEINLKELGLALLLIVAMWLTVVSVVFGMREVMIILK